MKFDRFFVLALMIMLIGSWGIHFSAEGAKTPVPTITPTGFSATAVSPTQIDLSWTSPTQNYGKIIVGYKIEQEISNGVYDVIVDNTGSTIATYSMTGLKTGIAYTYRVSAIYSDDTSTDPSNPATAIPLSTSTHPTASSSSTLSTNVKFDFVPSDGTILTGVVISSSDYLSLQYKKDPRGVILDPKPTSASRNNSLESLIAYQTNHESQDSVPAPLIAKSVSPTQIDLSWLPPLESYGQTLQGYKIELKNAPEDYQIIDDNTGNDTTKYTLTGLTPGSTYTYRVSAVYIGTHSNPSNEASATLPLPSLPVEKQNQTITISPSNTSPSNTPTYPTNNVRLDFTAPDGTLLSGVILSQNDYQQFVVIKDPRTILSNVGQTPDTINNDLAGLIQYQKIHAVLQSVNPPPEISNSTTPQSPVSKPSTSNSDDSLKLLEGIITSVVATGVVGIITWLVRTKVAKKIAKEYNFTLDKFSTVSGTQIRIRNSGETIEDCVIICDRHVCIWTDTNIDKPRHVYEGSISSAKILTDYENKNPLIVIKSGKKILKKIRLDDMAHG
jgi:titin